MSVDYEITIGMEIHAELATATKMFDGVRNDPFGAAGPNQYAGPLTWGLPGTLPVANRRAIELAIDLGADLGCTIAPFTKWDRKNYFYPDLPKGYQISQYDLPLLAGGAVEFLDREGNVKRIELTRIHLEEDAGKLTHLASPPTLRKSPSDGEHFRSGSGESLIDLNRAGVPLLELVTEPVLHSADDAKRFCQTYQFILQRRGISHADMEKGELRCEANISVRRTKNRGQRLGTKVEVKNLNSFRAVERAITYEVERQSTLIESGESVQPETRGWDDAKQQTYRQRTKETAADYRYFPDPDLPPLTPGTVFDLDAKAKTARPYPHVEAAGTRDQFGVSQDVAHFLTSNILAYQLWTELRSEYPEPTGDQKQVLAQAATMYANIDVVRSLAPSQLLELALLIIEGTISKSQIRDIAIGIASDGLNPKEYIDQHNLAQSLDSSAIETIVDQVLVDNADAVAKIKAGDNTPFSFLVGQVMRAAQGKANPAIVNTLLRSKLS